MASRQYSTRRAKAVAAALLVAALLAPVAARCGAEAASARAKKGTPVVVTARSLLADNKKKVVIYKKDVVVKKDDITMYADEVVIRLSPEKNKAGQKGGEDIFKGSGKIDRIEAHGGVKVVQQDKTATSDDATYYNAEDKIVLTGRPRVWQGGNVINGSRITYNIREDTFTVDDADTVLYQPEGAAPAGAGARGKE